MASMLLRSMVFRRCGHCPATSPWYSPRHTYRSYAHDELAMSMMRMRLRLPGEVVAPHEAVYKVGALRPTAVM